MGGGFGASSFWGIDVVYCLVTIHKLLDYSRRLTWGRWKGEDREIGLYPYIYLPRARMKIYAHRKKYQLRNTYPNKNNHPKLND